MLKWAHLRRSLDLLCNFVACALQCIRIWRCLLLPHYCQPLIIRILHIIFRLWNLVYRTWRFEARHFTILEYLCVAWRLCLLEIVTVCKRDSLVFLVRHSAIVCVYRACLIVIDLCSVCIRRQQCIPCEHVSPQNGRYSMNRVKGGSAHQFICLNSKCWWPNSQTRLWEGNCCFVKKWLTGTVTVFNAWVVLLFNCSAKGCCSFPCMFFLNPLLYTQLLG